MNRDNLSRVVVFCADEHKGVVSGGTATAVHLAAKLGIETYNIRKEEEFNILLQLLELNIGTYNIREEVEK